MGLRKNTVYLTIFKVHNNMADINWLHHEMTEFYDRAMAYMQGPTRMNEKMAPKEAVPAYAHRWRFKYFLI